MRLIDATRLVELALLERDKIPLTIVERYSFGTGSPNRHGQSMRGGIRKILRLIEQSPTIDAVPVVRCKDCRRRGSVLCPMRYEEPDGYLIRVTDSTVEDGYCAYGQRKERQNG